MMTQAEHHRKQDKQRIFSPDCKHRNTHKPKIFPPPKVIDRKVDPICKEAKDNKQNNRAAPAKPKSKTNVKKRKRTKSLKDIYHEYGSTPKRAVLVKSDEPETAEYDEKPIENPERDELQEETTKNEQDTSLSADIPVSNEAEIPTKTLVKLPVLLANSTFDIHINRTIQVDFPVDDILQVDWSLGSLETRVLLPSTTVFIKGVLLAEIKYVSKETKAIHSCKVPIRWDKVTFVDWLITPEMSSEYQNEYTFPSSNQDFSTHYELAQSFAEKIENDLRDIHFIWHHLVEEAVPSTVAINGSGKLSVNLLQKQYISM